MFLIAAGIWLTADGILSMVLVSDKRFFWQLARAVRAVIGVCLLWKEIH